MEVESLFQHVATPTVIKNFPTLMKRIAGADLPHGADILIQLHQRMLRQLYPGTLSPSHAPPIVDLKQYVDALKICQGLLHLILVLLNSNAGGTCLALMRRVNKRGKHCRLPSSKTRRILS
jgi:hypothetical protein